MLNCLLVGMTLALGQVESGTLPVATAPMNTPGAPSPVVNPMSSPSAEAPAPNGAAMPNCPAPAQNGGSGENGSNSSEKPKEQPDGGYFKRLFKIYADEFRGKDVLTEEEPEPPRGTLPSPFPSPPFPGHEYQGYPLVGVPPEHRRVSLDEGHLRRPVRRRNQGQQRSSSTAGSPHRQLIATPKIPMRRHRTGSFPTALNSISSSFVWSVSWTRCKPTTSTGAFAPRCMYGMDYRYTTAGGWFSDQLLKAQPAVRVGSHGTVLRRLLPGVFAGNDRPRRPLDRLPGHRNAVCARQLPGQPFDSCLPSTPTPKPGVMFTVCAQRINWMVQIGINSGNDMAPWYTGATPSGFFGLRWVAQDNNDCRLHVPEPIQQCRIPPF